MELITITTQDGYVSEGLFWQGQGPQPATKLGAIFVHGWTFWCDRRVKWRGFCGALLAETASALSQAGIPAVLTMNRGFHAPEFFNECARDFEANIDFLVSRGCEGIVLIGHSLGGAKCAYYAGEVGHPRVRAVVLLSAIPSTYNFKGKESLIDAGRQLVAEGRDHFLIPYQEGQTVAIHEAETLLRNFESGYQGTTLDATAKITVPILSLAAAGEWSWFQEVSRGIRARAQRAPSVESEIVEGARDHGYSGAEAKAAQLVRGWVSKVLS